MSEEMKNMPAGETAEQVKKQAGQVSGEEAPEFYIDENGEFHALLKDWGFDEEGAGEKAETDQKEQEQIEEKTQYYTPEELAKLSLEQIDLEKVAPEVRPYYQALLQEFEKKKTEAKKLQPEVPQVDEQAIYRYIQTEAIKRVEAKLGEKFDEMNPQHIAALAVESALLTQQVAKALELQKKIASVMAQEPYFTEIDQYAMQKLQDLPYKEAQKIVTAIQTGDFETLYEYWEACRKEFYQKKLGKITEAQQPQSKPQQAQVVPPPQVETPGRGEVATRPKISPKDFAYMTDEEKAQALIELGLV